MAEIIGRARANARGYYPDDGTHCRIIEEGEEFNLVAGHEKGRWFTRLDAPEAEAPKPRKGKKVEATAEEAPGEDIV